MQVRAVPGVPSRPRPCGQVDVAVADLGASEQIVVHALRAVRAGKRPASGLRLAATPGVRAALERYASELGRDEADIQEPARLSPVEACTLRAISCMQAGLLGEAWKVLVEICPPGRAGDALIALEEVAAAKAPAPASLA